MKIHPSSRWFGMEGLDNGDFHIVPVGDLVEHEPDGCVCGPRAGMARGPDGMLRTCYLHRSLDGREFTDDE